MTSNYFRNAINLSLVLISAFFCAFIILVIGASYFSIWLSEAVRVINHVPFDENNIGRLCGHAFALLILLAPVVYCGAAFGRFCLRVAPPRLSGRVRLGALFIFLLPALLYALLAVQFLLNFAPSSESLQRDRSQSISTAAFGVLFLIWFGAFAFILFKRHLRPLSFLDQPYVLFLRSFSKFSDRTVISLILRQMPVGKPIVFLAPLRSRAADWNPFLVGFAGMKLLHPFRSVPVIVKSPNTEWEQAIQDLIERAQTVILDISEKTNSIQAEVDMINKAGCWQKTILLKAFAAKTAAEREEKFEFAAAQIVYYRKSWLRAIPRMIFGYFLISLSAASLIAMVGGPINDPIVSILCFLFGILFFGWLYVSFFVRASIDRASKLSLKKTLLTDRKVTLYEGADYNPLNRRHDQKLAAPS